MYVNTSSSDKQSGIGCLALLIFMTVLFVGLLFGFNYSVKYYYDNCYGLTFSDCVLKKSDEQPEPESVTATGPYSYSGHSIVVTMHIPLAGGKVLGTVTGDCSGQVHGTFDGTNNGVISGNITGTCTVVIANIPAKATFAGMVNKDTKAVPITFSGSGGGFTHSGSMSLSY